METGRRRRRRAHPSNFVNKVRAPLLRSSGLSSVHGYYVKVVIVEVVIVELGQDHLPLSQTSAKLDRLSSKEAPRLQPARLRPPVHGTEFRGVPAFAGGMHCTKSLLRSVLILSDFNLQQKQQIEGLKSQNHCLCLLQNTL